MIFFLTGNPAEVQPGNLFDGMWLFVVIFFIFWLIVIRPHSKQEQKRQAMLKNLKKGDQVITSSGMVGKVADLRENGHVVLKIDESGGAKATFLASAILSVVKEESSAEKK